MRYLPIILNEMNFRVIHFQLQTSWNTFDQYSLWLHQTHILKSSREEITNNFYSAMSVLLFTIVYNLLGAIEDMRILLGTIVTVI